MCDGSREGAIPTFCSYVKWRLVTWIPLFWGPCCSSRARARLRFLVSPRGETSSATSSRDSRIGELRELLRKVTTRQIYSREPFKNRPNFTQSIGKWNLRTLYNLWFFIYWNWSHVQIPSASMCCRYSFSKKSSNFSKSRIKQKNAPTARKQAGLVLATWDQFQ